jgi:YYY domain-containing protein
MLDALLWYLVVTLLGWISFPFIYRLFPALEDRGYSVSRAAGWLIWGVSFWLLSSLGWLPNNPGGILFAWMVLLVAGGWALRGRSREILGWLSTQRRLVLVVELLFLGAFGLMALIRAANPEIVATEKPMELAFLNAIQRSEQFPPLDPWLSGYAISYYYLGYVLVSLLATLLGTPMGVAFNLGITLVFALAALGAYGLVFNLLSALRSGIRPGRAPWQAMLGPLFVLILSNLGGLLEVLHLKGLFWVQNAAGEWHSAFWRWLDIRDLVSPPVNSAGWLPERYLWWWRSSRVLMDYNLAGGQVEIIDEFPFFSFLLADLHPHVLALPFALLAITLALNLFLGGAAGEFRLWKFRLEIQREYLLFAILTLGGLAFLNTWDFPIYAALFASAFTLRRAVRSGWSWDRLGDFLGVSFVVGIGGVLLYLPFFLGFQSQAGGILPNLVNPTRGAHLWVMFGTLFVPALAYLIYLVRRWVQSSVILLGLALAIGLTGVLWLLSLGIGWVILQLPGLGDLFLSSLSAGSQSQVWQAALTRRFLQPGGWITLVVLLGLCLAILRSRTAPVQKAETSTQNSAGEAHLFVTLLIGMGGLLVLAPEFIFLRDFFNNRMNTIFKFYYQAWLMFGVAAAFGFVVLWQVLHGISGWLSRGALLLVLAAGLIYPTLSLITKTNGFEPPGGFTLDGTAYRWNQSPDEMAALEWLAHQPSGVVAEAVGGSYSTFGRVATHTGLPTVLGWPFHEIQWRGSADLQGSREVDIERLYCTNSWDETQVILERYRINYVFVGPQEYQQYQPGRSSCPEGLQERKFERNLSLVYENGSVRIYQTPGWE